MKQSYFVLLVGGLIAAVGSIYFIPLLSAESSNRSPALENLVAKSGFQSEDAWGKGSSIGKNTPEKELAEDRAAWKRELMVLEREVGALSKRVDHLAALVSQINAENGAKQYKDKTASADGDNVESLPTNISEQPERIEEIFSEQPDNPAWSNFASRTIRQAFDDEALGALLAEVDCRSTICRAVVQHDDSEKRRQFLETFPPASLMEAFPEVSTGYAKTSKDMATIIYFKGNQFSNQQSTVE